MTATSSSMPSAVRRQVAKVLLASVMPDAILRAPRRVAETQGWRSS